MFVERGEAGATLSAINGYTSAVRIHEGAETVVYRARAAGTDAPVILKLTKNEYPTARELARLRREFSLLRELRLPEIPEAHALEERRALPLAPPRQGDRAKAHAEALWPGGRHRGAASGVPADVRARP